MERGEKEKKGGKSSLLLRVGERILIGQKEERKGKKKKKFSVFTRGGTLRGSFLSASSPGERKKKRRKTMLFLDRGKKEEKLGAQAFRQVRRRKGVFPILSLEKREKKDGPTSC